MVTYVTTTLEGTNLEVNTIDNTVSWEQLKKFFGGYYSNFEAWMRGQTCTENGVYVWDVEKYIKGNRYILD